MLIDSRSLSLSILSPLARYPSTETGDRGEKEERIKEPVSDHKARQPAGEEVGEEKRTGERRMRGAKNRCLGTDALGQ